MTTLTFDTLRFVETLKTADFTDKQAKAVCEAFKEAFDDKLGGMIAKRDLVLNKRELALKLAETELRLIQWIIGSSGIVVILVKRML